MAQYYILVRSSTYAAKTSKLLRAAGFRTKYAKSPRSLNVGGCGHAVVVENVDISQIIDLISSAGMPEFEIFMTYNGKDFKEIHRW